MTRNRKTVKNITIRALKKCTQYHKDGVHVYCTPAEFLALCWHFDTKPRMIDYYVDLVKNGICSPANHYIHVKKWDQVFPQNKYACLNLSIVSPYY